MFGNLKLCFGITRITNPLMLIIFSIGVGFMAKRKAKVKTATKNFELIYWKLLTVVLAIILIVFLVINFNQRNREQRVISPNKAGVMVVGYVNRFMVPPGVSASLMNIKELNCLYVVNISISGHNYITYITKDGKLFFPMARNIEESERLPQQPNISTQK